MKSSLWLAACAAGAVALSVTAGDLSELSKTDRRWYEAVRPAKAEQKWKQIPWETNLLESIETARKEKRPLLLWVSFDEPLDRC